MLRLNFTNDSGTTLYEGQMVKIKAAGTVDKCSADTDIAIGQVRGGVNWLTDSTATSVADQGTVVVDTFFETKTNIVASGAIVVGDVLYHTGSVDSTTKYPIFKTCTGNAKGNAIALASSNDAATGVVGILRSPMNSPLAGKRIVGTIVATSTSTTTDFGILKSGDKIAVMPAANGTPANTTGAYYLTCGTDGTLPAAAVVGNTYTVYR